MSSVLLEHLRRFFEKTWAVFLLAIILPFFFGKSYYSLKYVIEVCLGVVMFFSIRPFLRHRFMLKERIRSVSALILLSYVLLSGTYLLLAYLLFGTSHDFFIGYFLIAIVPPAIAIIPMCYLSKCDVESTDAALFIAFALSLLIIPGSVYLFFGKSVDFWMLSKIMLILIVIPVFLAFFFRKSKSRVFHYGKALTNICLGAVIFVSTSFNKEVFFDFSDLAVIEVYVINIAVIFGLGVLLYFIGRRFSFDAGVSGSLYASQKNVGTAITLGIFLFSPKVAVPAIIALLMQFVYLLVFEALVKRKR